MKYKFIAFFIAALLMLLNSEVQAQDGKLDTTFASTGIVINSIGSTNDFGWTGEAHSTLLQSDGKIILAGFSGNADEKYFAAVRYDINGNIDNTFGNSGIVTTAINSSDDRSYSAAIQSDGKIVLGGYSAVGGAGSQRIFALVRYNTDGSLDNTFGANGKVTTAIDKSDDEIFSVAIQQDGKIVAVGTSYEEVSNQNINTFALVRYNSDGSIDNTFGTNGIVINYLDISGTLQQDNRANSVIVQSDGKLILGGYCSSSSNYSYFVLARYNGNGSFDNSFGGNGIVVTAVGIGNDVINALAIHSDGKIVAAGFTQSVNGDSSALARYNLDGSLDSTFGASGVVTTLFGQSDCAINSIVIQSDGKIVAAGYSGNGIRNVFAVARYKSNGSLDSAFGTNGITTTLFYADDEAYSAAIQYDGKVVAAGKAEYNNFYNLYGFAVMRYTGNAPTGINNLRSNRPSFNQLNQNYPNPFNPSTAISYQLSASSHVTLKLYDILGREVATLIDADQKAGEYKVQWNGHNNSGTSLASGIYLYSLDAGNYKSVKKMIYLK